jgi:mannan endo-1,4-beta-mannosidase
MNEQSKALWDLVERASKIVTDTTWKSDFENLNRAPVNPYLMTPAKNLLQKLYDLRGKRILTGQHEYLEAPYSYSDQVFTKTGKRPMVKGIELGGISGQSDTLLATQRAGVVNAAKAWHDGGGVITATYHAVYPGTPSIWSNVQRATTQSEFDQIVTSGTDLYKALLRDIDLVAASLKVLRNYGVPVLWRPYHEMNGGWFWWGNKNNFAALWEIMYDRFVNLHALDNLIWVWCPNAKNQWCQPIKNFYVGYDRVDVLALDIYSKDFKQSHHDELAELSCGKLLAIGENGELPTMSTLSTAQNKYSWFLTWGKMLSENNSDATIKTVYTDAYSFNRNEIVAGENGLSGNYYSGVAFNELKGQRRDAKIDFNWSNKVIITGLPIDNFSVRWTGILVSKSTEQYKIITYSDDGARVYINGALVVNKWTNGANWGSGLINLVKDVQYDITVEFYDASAAAIMQLYWESATVTKEIIPETNLYIK